jgi:hypothetical protein
MEKAAISGFGNGGFAVES